MSEETLRRQDAGGELGITVWSEDDGQYLVSCPLHVDTPAVDCLICEPVDEEPAEAPVSPVIVCGPPTNCFDDNVNRHHCMRGFDGAPDGVCPLKCCEKRGANR